jgi:hypothetical protein
VSTNKQTPQKMKYGKTKSHARKRVRFKECNDGQDVGLLLHQGTHDNIRIDHLQILVRLANAYEYDRLP